MTRQHTRSFLRFALPLFFVIYQHGYAQNINPIAEKVDGFRYGKETAPSGKEWESPEDLSLNKELPHAYFFSFQNSNAARKVLPENSKYWQSLDGTWSFNWVKTPEERPKNFFDPKVDISSWDKVEVPMNWNIYGIQKDGSLKYGVPIYSNQRVIFQHSVKVDDWRGGVMRTPPSDWTTYIYRNEVGSYRRTFSVPKDWDGREVYINFDGVNSFFYLWINGHYVGFSKNSRSLASFDISKYLNTKGENTVAVEVYRNSDASYLEDQDMFRLPGIFRTVSLTSVPTVHIRDFVAIPDLDAQYNNGALNITAQIQNLGDKKADGYHVKYSLYANKLYSDDNDLVDSKFDASNAVSVDAKNAAITTTTLSVQSPNKWSAEQPYRYTLIAELLDKKNKTIETISTIVGFRKVEIKDTKASDDEFGLAGRYYYVNGKTVKLKGTNRHEMDPERGQALTRAHLEKEVMLMKQANINHVRNSHYPNIPYWYYLCNKYGIYLEDEANIESHEYYYGKESLSHPKEWEKAHVARNVEMVHANINNPSIVIWSLGNEAGPGKNFVAAYNAIKHIDLSRPVQYERNNDIVDMGSNQYPSIEWVRGAVKGKFGLKYPFHISEYAHSMGNAGGNLVDYWKAIESTNFFMGGALWDWVDQSLYFYDKKTGEKYPAYGGDFGDKPNDGTFSMNGYVFSDLTPKPQYFEVKKVYQNVGVTATDMHKGKIEIFNKNYFSSLNNYTIKWSLYQDGLEVKSGTNFAESDTKIAPRQRKILTIPYDFNQLNPQSEYFVKIQFLLAEDMPWAKKGFVQMDEQLPVKAAENKPTLASVANGTQAKIIDEAGFKTIRGENYEVKFDQNTGTIYSLQYAGNKIISDGNGPKLDAWRAPADNDNWAYQAWFEKGLHNLKHKVLNSSIYTKNDGTIVLAYSVESQAPNGATILGGSSGTYTIKEKTNRPFGEDDFKFNSNIIWTIYKDGSIELESGITSNDPSTNLARIGYSMQLPSDLANYSYYGRGPINNYADRKTGQFIEQYNSTVTDQFVLWPKPQTTGNREDIRWSAFTNNNGNGAIFIATDRLSASALPWSAMEMTLAPHYYQLPQSTGTHFHVDAAVTGLGGNSCGQGPPLEQDRVKATPRVMGFIIRPIAAKDFTQKANIIASGAKPLMVVRNKVGDVTIEGNNADKILYSIGNETPKTYTQSFSLRQGGIVNAWYSNNDKSKVVYNYPKIESIPLEVVFASSEESGDGNAKNLVDGNPSTIWHTMYSVTVAQYPHWVDFDAGSVKNIKGFTYLPRQDGGNNGDVKSYKLQVSMDGKEWGTPISEGQFSYDKKLKTVRFDKPIKARYVRFTALSSQNGQDFAGGSEFSILAD